MEIIHKLRRRIGYFILPIEDRNLLTTDPLTGVYNRGFWERNLSEAVELVKVINDRLENNYIILFMIDVDNFKKYNDTEGHAKGDEVLKKVANGLKNAVRHSQVGRGDIVARYGGDEFFILAMDKHPPNADLMAQRIKDYQGFPITFGAICLSGHEIRENGFTTKDIMRMADELLYEAKRAGRNRGIVQIGFNDPSKQTIVPTPQNNGLQTPRLG